MRGSPRFCQQGFLVITVVLVLAVFATMALMLSNSTSLDNAIVAKHTDGAVLDYVAKSGFEHATWQLAQNSACTGYTDLPSTAFGNDSYSASVMPSAGSPVSITATATLANNTQRSLIRDAVKVYSAESMQTVILQPGPEGDDAEIWAQGANNNYGDSAETWVSSASNDTTRSLLSFNMDMIPAAAKILDATLSLRRQSGAGGSQPVSAHRIRNQWSEDSVTWNNRESGTSWDTAGGDFEHTPIVTTLVGPANDRYEWNVTPLVQVWIDGGYPNYGVALVAAIDGMSGERFHTSDDANVNRRPSLSVTYVCECGQICTIAGGAGNRIILTTQDQATLGGLTFEDDDLVEYDAAAVTASHYFAGTLFSGNEDIKALHVLGNGHIGLSTSSNATLGGLTFKNGDVVDYDPVGDSATLVFSEDVDAGVDMDIDALHILDNGNLVFSVDTAVAIGLLSVHDGDLIEWNPGTGIFSLYFDHNIFTTDANVDGLHLLDNGHMIFSTTGIETLGGLNFDDGDLVDYDPVGGGATLYFTESGSFATDTDINAVHIVEAAGTTSPGPIAHWKLDETSGLVATDTVGGNDGTLTNGPAWIAGKLNGGLLFDGGNDYIDVSSMNPMSYDDFTVVAWYKSADSGVSDDEYIFEHNDNFAYEVTFGPTDDGTDDRLRFGFTSGGSGTWDPHYGTSDIVDQQWHHVVGVRASGRIILYVDGTEETDEADAHAGVTITIDGDGPFIGDLPGNTEQIHGTLDDVRLYDRALTATEILDLFTKTGGGGGGGGGGAGGAGYVEAFATWFAKDNGKWHSVDLGVLGVPPDTVAEVAIVNKNTDEELWGGVRAEGSKYDRRLLLHEAESGGDEVVVMHVMTDSSARIEHYTEIVDDVYFVVMGYWASGTYVERFDQFSAGGSKSWREHDLSPYGVGSTQVAEILLVNTNASREREAGIRSVGSGLDRRLDIHEAESGGIDAATLLVTADASANAMIEVFTESDADVDFYLTGYWSLAPGKFTEAAGISYEPTTPSDTWSDWDLASRGVPANSTVHVALLNSDTNQQSRLGVRETGSANALRYFRLQEAESGGSDIAVWHINLDSKSNGQWWDEVPADDHPFLVMGWWQ